MGKAVIGFAVGVILTSVVFFELQKTIDDATLPSLAIVESSTEAELSANGVREVAPPSTRFEVVNPQSRPTSVTPPSQVKVAAAISESDIPLMSVQALPSLPGVAIQIPRPQSLDPAQQLAGEEVDPEWSEAMEARILAEIPAATTVQMNQINVECRSTWCGIVLGVPESVDYHGAYDILAHLGRAIIAESSERNLTSAPDGFWVFYIRPAR